MFYDLVKDADILVENYRGGVTKKLGIDYETVKKINPSIIYASCSGFGQYGPLTHRACYDIVAQAMGGMVNLTGFKDTDPVKVGPSVADHVSGIYLTVGVLAALIIVDMTGEGQQVDVSMFDTIFSLLENALVNYTMAGEISQRNGNIDPSIAPFDIFPCKDGFTALGVGNDRLFDTFCHTIGHEELLGDPRYETNDLRCKNYLPELQELIRGWCMEHTKKEIEYIMDEAGIMWTGIRCKRSDRTSTYTGKRDDGSLRTSYGRRSLFPGMCYEDVRNSRSCRNAFPTSRRT